MRSFTVGSYRLDFVTHSRVFGEHFPRPTANAVAECFEVDCYDVSGRRPEPFDWYPNAKPHPHPERPQRMTFYWAGEQFHPTTSGGKRGADFRTRLFPTILQRIRKAEAALRLGVPIGDVPADALDKRPIDEPLDLRGKALNEAVLDLTGEPARVATRIPRGTVANIDVDFDSDAYSSGSEAETGTSLAVSNNFFFVQSRVQFRFPLSSLPTGATINDSDLQFNVINAVNAADEGVIVKSYGTSGGQTNPDTDSGSTKYTNSDNGSTLANIAGCNSTGSKTGDLGATADGHIQTNIDSPDFYAIGLTHLNLETSEYVGIESIENAGSDPATLTVDYTEAGPTEVGLTASEPAGSAVLSILYKIAATASQPAQSAVLTAALLIIAPEITASQPAQSALLDVLYKLSLATDQPAQTADLTTEYKLVNLGASQPGASAVISVTYFIGLEAEQPAQSADLDLVKYLIDLTADQPTQSAALIFAYVIALAASQPSQTTALSIQTVIALTASQPGQSTALSILLAVSLASNQPGQSASILFDLLHELGNVDGGFLEPADMLSASPAGMLEPVEMLSAQAGFMYEERQML